ncbi:MAG: bifunctional riboflavin kinase/FAD synthetase [Tissierellaceae bacterium]
MEIIDLLNYRERRFGTAIALGNFDGLHLGHQKLIETMVDRSRELGVKPSLLLFKGHTRATIKREKPKMITNNEHKFQLAKDLGVEIVYLLDFNEDIMRLSGEEFIRDIVLEKINGKLIVVGFDYRFGYKASGDTDYLIDLGKKYSIDIEVVNPVIVDDNIVSSSYIRNLISLGKIQEVKKALGRPYSILGNVIPGSNRGNKLGFPTANIELIDSFVIPKTGVYFTNTIIDNRRFISATNIGYNPTFDGDKLKIETFILNFSENIYGKTIEIEFMDFLRDDIRFRNSGELIKQMELDIETIKNRY